MHRTIKKGFVILLGILLIVSTACSSSGGGNSNDNGEKPLELTVLLEGFGSNFPRGGPAQEQIEDRTNTNLAVNWIPYTEYESRFNVQLTSGTLPDIMATVMPSGQLFSSQVIQAINAKVFHDLTPYIEDPEFASKYPNLAKYDDQVWDLIRFQGKIFAMPRYIQPITANSGIIIRKDLMEDAGLEEPKTMEEFADFLITLSDKYNIYGLNTPNRNLDSTAYKPLAVAFTGVQDWGVDDEGNFFFQSFMPEYKDFLLWMKKLFDAGAIDPEFSLEQNNSDFALGNSAARLHVWWNWKQGPEKSPFSDEFLNRNPDAKAWALLPLEGPKAKSVAIQPFNRPALISKEVPEEKIPQVLELFDYTASEEHQELMRYGIEGVHHEVENGQKTILNKHSEDAIGHWEVMFNNMAKGHEVMIEEASRDGVSEEDMQRMEDVHFAALEAIEEADISMPHWGVESQTYFDKWSSLVRDLNDNRIRVIMGDMSMEQWDSYVKGIVESADYQKILEEFKESWEAAQS